jgi:chemotaxis protein histidine kinase CheA
MSSNISMNADWLRDARSIYLSDAPAKITDLERAISAVEQNPSSNSHERRLRRLLHNLIGSGGSYGFPAISETARQMSDRLHKRLNARLPVDADTVADLRQQLDELRSIFHDARA